MSAIEVVGVALAAIDIVFAISLGLTTRFKNVFSSQSYRNRRFGFPLSLLVSLFTDLEQLEEAEERLCNLNDEELIKWRDSYVARLNIIPVAGAIFGQVALTGLALPGIGSIHWAARGLMVVASTLGIGSVVAASHCSTALSQLYKADDVRTWFSQELITKEEMKNKKTSQPLRSSFSAQQLLSLPSFLLSLAGLSYIAGFGVYVGLIWTNDVPAISLGLADNRNVFVVFMLSLLPIFTWMLWTLLKAQEQSRFKEQIVKQENQISMRPYVDSPLYGLVLLNSSREEELQVLVSQRASRGRVTEQQQGGTFPAGPIKTTLIMSHSNQLSSPHPSSVAHDRSTRRYTFEEAEYLASLRAAAEARRQTASADTLVASKYTELAAGSQPGPHDHIELTASLRQAADASRKTAAADMAVLEKYEAMIASTSSGQP